MDRMVGKLSIGSSTSTSLFTQRSTRVEKSRTRPGLLDRAPVARVPLSEGTCLSPGDNPSLSGCPSPLGYLSPSGYPSPSDNLACSRVRMPRVRMGLHVGSRGHIPRGTPAGSRADTSGSDPGDSTPPPLVAPAVEDALCL